MKIAVCSLFFQWKLVLAAILPVVSLESDLKLYALLFVMNGSAFFMADGIRWLPAGVVAGRNDVMIILNKKSI